jgi:hypothetical protein
VVVSGSPEPNVALAAPPLAHDSDPQVSVAEQAFIPSTAPPERGLQEPWWSRLSRSGVRRGASHIESEIVIVDDDGAEEPFDSASWSA